MRAKDLKPKVVVAGLFGGLYNRRLGKNYKVRESRKTTNSNRRPKLFA